MRRRFDAVQIAPEHDERRPILRVKIRETFVSVRIDDDGNFRGVFGGTEARAPSLDELRERLVKASRRRSTKVEVEAMRITHDAHSLGHNVKVKLPYFEPVILTGVHASHGSIIYRRVDAAGKKTPALTSPGRSYSRHGGHFYRVMTEEEQDEFRKLYRAKEAADAAFEKFDTKVAIDAGDVIQETIDAKVREQEAADSE